MKTRAIWIAGALAIFSSAALAQESGSRAPAQPSGSQPGATTAEQVVPYCIEPMESMPPKILALIDEQFRCAAGTHLKRDSRPARVVPTGEESLGRPFVIRFGPPETANAWYVRGYTVEQQHP